MNLKNLHHVYTTAACSITRRATESGLDPVVTMGVVKLMLANDGNLASLSSLQRRHYELVIRPLIE